MKTRDNTIIQKMREESEIVLKITQEYNKEDFLNNLYANRAAAMPLINIGELSIHLTTEFKKQNDRIPLKEITEFRNTMAHHYGTISKEDIWDYAKIKLPLLLEKLTEILDKEISE
jgi:uncharacterized protein with HEPN domain